MRASRMVSVVAGMVLVLAVACGGGDGEAGPATGGSPPSRPAGPAPDSETTTTDSACPSPQPADVPTTTAGPVPSPLPEDLAGAPLARATLVSVDGSQARLRWEPGQGVEPCETTVGFDRALVLEADGYAEVDAAAAAAFVDRRRAELGTTSEGIPFLVTVPAEGTDVTLVEVPPG